MNGTKKRIEKYKELLPHLKERVVAVALLLAISTTMLATVSFAWLTISKHPEAANVNTSIASNGNLEIALVGDKGGMPFDSAVGDSVLDLIDRNITWGNLVNLSDPAYGLDNLVLRPAQLNKSSLLTNPLYSVVYDESGRAVDFNSNFGYASWIPAEGDKPGYFKISDQYGVRAISSVTVEAVGAAQTFLRMKNSANAKNLIAANSYLALGENDKYMPSLATMMGLYMTARMNPDDASLSNPSCNIEDIQNLRDMYAEFLKAFDAEAEAMAELVNLQLFLLQGEGNYTVYTGEMIYATTTAELKAKNIQITNLDQFKKDRNTIASDLEKLNAICEGGTNLTWKDSGLNDIVNNLVNVGACTIGADNTPISSIGASNAMSYLSGTQEARITNGILYRFEERTAGYIEVKNLGISATVKRMGITVPATVKANIATTAPRDYNLFANDLAYADSMNNGTYKGGEEVANDTYGLAIDLWVKTNAKGSYLTLEGNVLTETTTERATGKDMDGNEVELYTVTIQATEGEETSTYTLELYKKGDVWYNAVTHADETATLTDDDPDTADLVPVAKMVEVEKVIGYEGENRVWEGSVGLSVNSTTQGSGSCYVYYADTPEDQARSLELLSAMKVAFVNGNGEWLATAEMDTKHCYINSGRVIVPLVVTSVNSDTQLLGTDENGDPIYAITALEQNVATRITAIVYLDGLQLTNEDVLSSADIQGKLNIQFGSSESLNAMDNEKLAAEELTVTAQITGNDTFTYEDATEENPMTTSVAINVNGTQPKTVTAFFIRAINSTQGSREEPMTFTYNESSKTWEASYTFKVPGQYIIRSVQLDGADYDLDQEILPTVTIEGFTVVSLGWDISSESNSARILTAASSASINMDLKFASHDAAKMPQTVVGRFIREDGSVTNVKFTYDSNLSQWKGKATFLESGEYSLQYLVLDGEYQEIASNLQKFVTVNLGMKVEVYTTSNTSFKYLPGDENFEDALAMQVKIKDDAGTEMLGLTDVKLYYRARGSSAAGMDADLTWDAAAGYYIGSMKSTVGIFEFSYLTANSGNTTNTITKATRSPVFTIMSPQPPKYAGMEANAYQYVPNGGAWVRVTLEQTAAANVFGIFTNGTDEYTVAGVGTLENETSTTKIWQFTIPNNSGGTQDGNWQLLSVEISNVYDADGKLYTEDDPMVFDLTGEQIKTKVVQMVHISFARNMSQNFGLNDKGEKVGNFMDSYTISGLSVVIQDFEGKPLQGLSNARLNFTYNRDSSTYGGYTNNTLDNENIVISVPLTANGTTYSQTDAVTLQYAGSYTTSLSFDMSGTTHTIGSDKLPDNAPKYTVSSVAPSVKITEAFYASATSNTASTFTDTSTTVYAYNYKDTGSVCGVSYSYDKYYQPYVTITLSGYGNAAGAKMTFAESSGETVYLYETEEGSTTVSTYTWSGNGTCTRWVGYWNGQTGNDGRTKAGTLTATTLVLTYNGVEYNVSAPITINNPN